MVQLSADEVLEPVDDLRSEVSEALRGMYSNGWRFAVLCYRVKQSGAYTSWQKPDGATFRSLADWAEHDLGLSAPTVSRYTRAGQLIEEASDDDERKRWLAQPMSSVLEVLPVAKVNKDQALEIVESSASQQEARRKAKGEGVIVEEGVRTVKLTVAEAVYEEWCAAVELLKVSIGSNGTAHPGSNEVLLAAALTIQNAPELLRVGNRVMSDDERADVFAGLVRCQTPGCGSYAQLERHHIVPRSHGGVDAEGIEQLVWLCHVCHERVTRGTDEHWRDIAARRGVDIPSTAARGS